MRFHPMFPAGLAAALALAMPGAAVAAQSPKAASEIDHLRNHLSRSGCEFFRNGEWHDAESARKHIDRKYAYLRKRDLADTAEQFIERAATRSSTSGKAYRVRCGNGTPVEASRWFTQELQRHRGA